MFNVFLSSCSYNISGITYSRKLNSFHIWWRTFCFTEFITSVIEPFSLYKGVHGDTKWWNQFHTIAFPEQKQCMRWMQITFNYSHIKVYVYLICSSQAAGIGYSRKLNSFHIWWTILSFAEFIATMMQSFWLYRGVHCDA